MRQSCSKQHSSGIPTAMDGVSFRFCAGRRPRGVTSGSAALPGEEACWNRRHVYTKQPELRVKDDGTMCCACTARF
jgi:hypothetical protein